MYFYFILFLGVARVFTNFDLKGRPGGKRRERECVKVTGMFLEGIRKKEFTSMIALYYIHVLNLQYELGI